MTARQQGEPRVMVLHTGGLGDLVLNAELVVGLKQSPDRPHVTLVCKAEMSAVVDLYPVPPDEVIRLEVNPLAWNEPSEKLVTAFRPFFQELEARPVDVFMDATFQPSWLGWIAAALTQPKRACCCTAITEPHVFVSALSQRLGLKPPAIEKIERPSGAHEIERYRLLLRWMETEPGSTFPWPITPELEATASRLLDSFGFTKGEYLACFPCGSLGAEAKRWPMANFREVLLHVNEQRGLPILLVGENREREALNELASSIAEKPAKVAVSCGGRDGIAALAGALANARIYLGNDTGPTHLASAFGVPGVTIYGGGHWPTYAPWGAGSIGLVHPLPCFGCDWDCAFGHGICVEAITPALVTEAIDDVLRAPVSVPQVRTVEALPREVTRVIADAAPRYRAAQQDRAERWIRMIEQNVALERAEKATSEALREARNREEALQRAAVSTRERDRHIGELEKASADRLEALERAGQGLQALDNEVQQRAADVNRLTEWLGERDRRIAELEKASTDRLEALERVGQTLQVLDNEAQ
ncbi:MAG: hypothetical protein LLG20_25085, partial [Acidobacteriales bacterium]|nr:hypothetical protein [Terriglobales bacterium]